MTKNPHHQLSHTFVINVSIFLSFLQTCSVCFVRNPSVFTARKRSLRRLCFYRCLSFILFTRGGRAWFYLGGACVVLFGGACVVLLGGRAWFYSGRGGMVLFGGGRVLFYSGGACVVFSVFSDTMRYGQ